MSSQFPSAAETWSNPDETTTWEKASTARGLNSLGFIAICSALLG
jgi:hypothetical protein